MNGSSGRTGRRELARVWFAGTSGGEEFWESIDVRISPGNFFIGATPSQDILGNGTEGLVVTGWLILGGIDADLEEKVPSYYCESFFGCLKLPRSEPQPSKKSVPRIQGHNVVPDRGTCHHLGITGA